MKVVYIDKNSYVFTPGKIYEVYILPGGGHQRIFDDTNCPRSYEYHKSYFISLDEWRNKKIDEILE